jgi:hypothetical protein
MLIKTIYNLLIKNLHLKIISIVLAFVVFLAVHIYNNKEVIQSLDINLSLSLPENNMVVNKIPGKVAILLKGPLSEIKKIKKENISLPIHLKKSKTIILNEYNIPEFKNIKVIQIIPKTIDIVIEEVAEKKVPIQFNVINEVPAGYKYKMKPKLNKKFVTVIGPKSSVDLLNKVYSEPLNQATIIGSESKILKLKLESSLLRFKNTREVSVSYKIVEEFITKEMENLKIKFLNCDLEKKGIKALKSKVKLVVKMPYSLKNKFNDSDFFVYADLNNCSNFEYLTPIKLSIAVPHKKISVKYIIPDTVILKKLHKKDIVHEKKIIPRKEKVQNK